MNLKALRENNNLTQKELSDKLGINRMNYNRYELGKVEPDIKTLIKIADFYNVSIDYLCGHETNNKFDLSIIPNIKKENIELSLKLTENNDYKLNGYLTRTLEEQK